MRDLVAYRTDYWFSRSKLAKPVALVVATMLLIVAGAIALHAVLPVDFPTALWTAWVYVADPGAHSEQRGTAPRAVAFFLTVGGMFIFALVIGVVAEGASMACSQEAAAATATKPPCGCVYRC